jgi:hypothetical protein
MPGAVLDEEDNWTSAVNPAYTQIPTSQVIDIFSIDDLPYVDVSERLRSPGIGRPHPSVSFLGVRGWEEMRAKESSARLCCPNIYPY